MKSYSIKVTMIVKSGKNIELVKQGSLEELKRYFKYVLSRGCKWSYGRISWHINKNPKSIGDLVDNLNRAAQNSSRQTVWYEII